MQKQEPELEPLSLRPLPLGRIRPLGWLKRQLRIQAGGLSGHLHEFWPKIRDSEWIGGDYRLGWESVPYWLDGVVPLAFLLDDVPLKTVVARYITYILDHQREDGWLGPWQANPSFPDHDPWLQFPLLKALIQYQEVTGDERIIAAIVKSLRRLRPLVKNPDTPSHCARERWADLVLSIHWVYEHTGESWLLAMAEEAKRTGFDWKAHFSDFTYTSKGVGKARETHVVCNAMGVKQPGVWWRQARDLDDRDATCRILDVLDAYHGQVTGLFSGDEHFAGKNPSQGTELCAVVEYMFSLEKLIAVLGDPTLADRLERIAFNALPATFKKDMWAHQYVQQVNQAVCRMSEERIYTNNGPDANIFGLEPCCRCCTGNMHQGWPKFASHLWMRTPDNGIGAVAYAPSEVRTEASGVPVHVALETEYPFTDTLRITVDAESTVSFPLLLRIPAWATDAQVTVGGGRPVPGEAGTFHRVEREWRGQTIVTLSLPMQTRIERRFHGSVSVLRGPLVYALKIEEKWKRINEDEPGKELPHGDWEVYPASPWNYALELDPDNPDATVRFKTRPVGDRPFSPEGAPVRATLKGRRLPSWMIEHNAAGILPQSPVESSEASEELTLVPYGCTNLRISEFPLLRRGGDHCGTEPAAEPYGEDAAN